MNYWVWSHRIRALEPLLHPLRTASIHDLFVSADWDVLFSVSNFSLYDGMERQYLQAVSVLLR